MTRQPRTLRRRLVVSIVGIVALFAIAVGVLSITVLYRSLSDRLDDRLDQLLRAPFITSIDQSGQQPETDPLDQAGQQLDTIVVQLLSTGSGSGTVLKAKYTDGSGDTADLTTAQLQQVLQAVADSEPGTPETVDVDDIGVVRVKADSMPSGVIAVVGVPTDEVLATTWLLAAIYTLVAAVAIALVGAGASALVARQLRPLERVADTAVRVSQKELAAGEVTIPERVPAEDTDPGTEVGRVGASLNRLLVSVEDALGAREASEAKLRQFVADASHELRTPLAAVRGYAELAAREPERLSEQQRTSLDRIQGSSQRMSSLVEDLLLLARLDAGQQPTHVRLDANEVALGCFEDAAVAYPDHEWRLDAEAESLEVIGDRTALAQVLGNLLRNAAVHTDAGTRVTLATSFADGATGPRTDSGRWVRLTVTDTGGGIDPDVAPHIFERFVRGDASRTRASGQGSSGLGLAISQAIVQAHGGSLEVASRPGHTVFTVLLPAAPAAAVPAS
ncbi:sensor histidine kinase [Gulosibacter sediminis]|uniref:sensor histidine kinase n=1 Tax=Gulosibacter sediminis TaxID=1729695 RepID=UPI0024AE3723|nr:HAMP domain-containing sensor histidine kinase [Gulosibacter sediminis]